MSRSRIVQLVGLTGAGLLLLGSASRMPAINRGREALNILGTESPLENTPPGYVFYIQAFGAFRGLIADIAFIRADRLKEQGRFYDAMQLHKWICSLQPRFPSVWEYAAWNMAWNISVTTFTPQERWNWVYNGVKLLRDEGIPLNPRAVNLYKQLAWIFNNKMSEPTDEQHYAYKCNWAWRMHLLLGPPPDPLAGLDAAALADQLTSLEQTDRLEEVGRLTLAQNEEKRRKAAEAMGLEFRPREVPPPAGGPSDTRPDSPEFRLAQSACYEEMRRIKEAPATLDELYRLHPETRQMVAELRQLGIGISDARLTEDDYWRQEGLAFTFFKPLRALTGTASTLARVAQHSRQDPAEQTRAQALDRILGLKAGNPAGEALLRFLQRKVLLEVYDLDPSLMLDLIRDFGPLDWRAVDAHALYWVARGLIAGGETINRFGNDKTNTARIIFFSLRNLFLRGRITFEPNPDDINLSYLSLARDLNFVEPMHQAYVKYGPLFDPDSEEVVGAGQTYRSGHINFLTEAIRSLYLSGRESEAARYYRYLRETYRLTPTGEPNPAFNKNLHDFVMGSFLESTQSPGLREIALLMGDWLFRAFDELADGDTTAYARLVRAAAEYHEKYMREKRNDPTWASKRLPELVDLQVDAFAAWLSRPAVSPAITLQKARLWRNAPLYLRQRVYDGILPLLKSECERWDFDLGRAFPQPPGMEEHRQPPAEPSPSPGP